MMITLNSTTRIDIDPKISDYDPVDSLSDGTLTVSFAEGGEARTVPTSWLSWSSPPFSEGGSPRLVFTQPGSLILDSPVTTFGVEIEPNEISVHTVVVHFQDADGSDIGSISRDVMGDRGARLFAARVDPSQGDAPIASVSIETDPAAKGIGVAQVRYDMSGLGGAPHGRSGLFSAQNRPLKGIAGHFLQSPTPVGARDSVPVSGQESLVVSFPKGQDLIHETESPVTASNQFIGFHPVNSKERLTDGWHESDLDLLTLHWWS